MTQDPARARFVIIQIARVSGVALAWFGLMIIGGKFDLPPLAGYFFAVAGAVEAMVLPLLLARRWKTPSE